MNWDQIQLQWLAMTRRIRADLPEEDWRRKAAPLAGRPRSGHGAVTVPQPLPESGSQHNPAPRDHLTVE